MRSKNNAEKPRVTKKLSLDKSTLKRLTVRTGVRTGYGTNACSVTGTDNHSRNGQPQLPTQTCTD